MTGYCRQRSVHCGLTYVIRTSLLVLLLAGCAWEPPRTDSGRIDERQVKRNIDIDITTHCRIDVENGEYLCECKIQPGDLWCFGEGI
jgi:hypothetical protein